MISSPLSHSKLDATSLLDLKSREYLTNLLDLQIDRNEILESENMRLQTEQKKLTQLLQRKSAEIAKLRSLKSDKLKPQLINSQKLEQAKSNQSVITFQKQSTYELSLQGQKMKNNDSTAIFNNNSMSETNSEMIEILKHNIHEKQQQMKKMREYYTKCLENMENEKNKIGEKYEKDSAAEIEQYRTVIGKQKNRIKELMDELQKNEEQKSTYETEIQRLRNKKTNNIESESKILKQCQQKIVSLSEKHEAQLLAIQQVHQQQKQNLLHSHSLEIQSLQKNTIYKIQQIQQKSQKQILTIQQVVEAKQRQIDVLNKQCYSLQSKLKQQLIRFEQQCEIVMNIEHDRQRLVDKINKLEEDMRNKEQDMESHEINRINIDNIHKQYNSKLEEKEKMLTLSNKAVNQYAQQLELKNQSLGKLEQKIEENTKKYTQQIYSLEMEAKKYKEELQSLKEEMQYLEKQNKLKDQDNKRLISKINKESEKKEQYVKKLEDKITKLEGELTENEALMQEKEDDILKYREETQNMIQRLKAELMKKDSQLIVVFKQNEKKVKEMKQIQDHYEASAATLHNQQQQANKKYSAVCERLRIIQQQKINFKNLYEEVLKQLKNLDNKNIKLLKQNQKLKDENDSMEKQIDCLKEDILSNNLNQSEKQQLTKLRNEAYDLKAKINKLAENNNKIKDQNQKALRQNIMLVEKLNDFQGQNTKLINELQLKKEKLEQYEEKIEELDEQLRARCKELETSMPYVNKILEQKKANELQLQRKNNQIKKLVSLVEKAKLVKAEEITNLNREVEQNTLKINNLLSQIKDNRDVIQRFNREKVNMLRQNTVRQDLLKKYEKQIKVLRQNLKESQEHVDQLMNYLGVADSAMENVDLDQSFQKKSHRK